MWPDTEYLCSECDETVSYDLIDYCGEPNCYCRERPLLCAECRSERETS